MRYPKHIRIFRFIIPVILFTILSITPAFGTDLPTDDDLAQTMECEWATIEDPENPGEEINDPNDKLVALAASLDNDPVKIYNWVYKNIYSPQFIYSQLENGSWKYDYTKSRLGARGAYLSKRGNSWDQSSLLIALLRISNIPARYVQLGSYHLVYVEAWLDLDNYHGIADSSQKGWVPLFPWLKENNFIEGLDLFVTDGSITDPVPDGLEFDFKDYLSSPDENGSVVKHETTLEKYEEKLQNILNTNHPGKSLKDIPFNEDLIDNTALVLPRSFPSKLKLFLSVTKNRFSEVDPSNREYIRLVIRNYSSTGTSLLDYTLYMPKAAGKRFCLDWNYSGSSFQPVFKLDGESVQTSSYTLGADDNFYIVYQVAGQSSVLRDQKRAAGTFMQIGFDPLSASQITIEKAKQELQTVDASNVLDPSTHEEYLGLMGQVLSETFLYRLYENARKTTSYFYGIKYWGLSPTFIYTDYNSDDHPIPTDPESKFYYHPQWKIDAQSSASMIKWDSSGQQLVTYSTDPDHNNWDAPINVTSKRISGFVASFNEGRIFEDWMDTPGASTIKGLMIANEDPDNTGNHMVELTSDSIVSETQTTTSSFESVPLSGEQPTWSTGAAINDLYKVDYDEAYDGFQLNGALRVPDSWVLVDPNSNSFPLDADAIDGSYGVVVWPNAYITRGSKFDLKTFKYASLGNGAKYKVVGYRRDSNGNLVSVSGYEKNLTANQSPQIATFNWTDVHQIYIVRTTAATTFYDPLIIDNLQYIRKEYVSDLENQTEGYLGTKTVWDIIQLLDQGDTVVTPVQIVEHDGMTGNIRIVYGADGSDQYSFGMDNGGSSSKETTTNESYTDTNTISLDSGTLSSTTQTDWKDKYTTLVNGVETTIKKASETMNAAKTALGDPVDMVSGEFYTEETPDFLIKSRGLDLSIIRKYRSQLIYNGPFGYGWTWNHAERILPLAGGDVLYYNNDGDALELTSNGDGTYTCPLGSQFVLAIESGQYVITQNRTRQKSYFSDQGYLVRKEDRFGNTLTFGYGNTSYPGQITAITDGLGRSLTLAYNSNGKVISITDFEGRSCSYLYSDISSGDGLGDDLIEFRGLDYQTSLDNATRYEYLSNQENVYLNHNMTKYTLPGGDYLEIGYYKNDQAAYHTNAKGETFNFMYSRLNRYAETWNEEGYYRKVFFNEANDVIRVANEDGTIEQMAYDEYGHHNKISHTDGNGYTTTFQYYPDGAADPEAYVKKRNLYLKTDALGCTWAYQYDDTNNAYAPSQATDPAGNITQFEYDTNGSLYKKIQAPGYAFDGNQDLVADANATGFETVYEYDAYGNITRITDPLSRYEERIYDTNSLYLVTKKDKLGNETRYQYYKDFVENMPIGAVKSVTVVSGTNEYTTTYEYDQLGRKTKETDPLSQATQYQYTLDGKLEKITKPNGAVTQHIYDTARDIVSGAQIIETIDPLGNSVHFSYDATGKLIKKQDKNGNIFTFAYDKMGRLAKEVDPFRTVKNYVYDGNGNKTSIKLYNQAGVLLKETKFTYNAANQLVEKTIPCDFEEDGCEKTVQYQYTLDGKPQSQTIVFPEGDDLVTWYEYNALGRLKQETKGYGTDDARATQYRYDALGRLTRTIFPLGNSEVREYDANGNVTAVKLYDQAGTLMEETGNIYDARNLLVETVNPLGNSTYYTYDALGRKTEQFQFLTESGDMIQYQWQYDAVGNLVQETDPLGRLTRHGYDLNNQKAKTVDALGQTTAFEYDPNGNLVAVTYPDLSRTVTYYDALNRKIGVEDELGYIQTLDYDEDSNLVSHLDARKGISTFEYDAAKRLRRKTNALGYTEETEYDPADRVIQTTDARGIITLLSYDAASNLVSQTLASGTDDQTVTQFEYDLNNRKIREIHETTQGDQITAFEYDDRGLLTHRKNGFHTGSPEIWEYEYDKARQLVATIDPNGNTIQVFYDAVGRKKAQTQAQGLVKYYWEYDLAGNVTLERKPEGEEIQNAYDALNRLVLETRGGDQRRFEYDSRGHLTREENFNGDATQYQYDLAGRMTQKTEAAGTVDEAVSKYEYDENGNLVAITNPLLKTVSFEYDALNQRITETDSDLTVKTITYDENGNTLSIEKKDGTDIEFVWDNLNRKEATKVDTVIRQTFDYDVLSRLVSATDTNQGTVTHTATFDYNDYGRLETEAQDSYTIGKLYDNNGNKIQITYPSGRVVDKTYNENNALTQILYQGNTIADLTRDRNNRLTAASFGNGTGLALDYDTRERETLRTYTDTLFSQETGYDAQSNILEETLALNGTTREKEYTYDHQDRLVTATPSTTWDYDSVGNWLSTNQNGTAESRTANDDNEYTLVDGTAFIHDPNGNLTSDGEKDYVYDWANRLIQVEESGQVLAEYTYDAVNRRVTKTVGTTVTTYVYDETEVIEEYTGGTLSRSYVYSSSIDKPILLETGSQFYYYIADRQGSVWGFTDNTGTLVESYEYTPFGLMTIYDSQGQDITATGSAIGNPFGYTGRRWDSESGLWYYRNRMYSAELGRFLQRDPAGYVDGLNLYQYTLNNPLRYIDPMGLTSRENDFSYSLPIINLNADYQKQQQDWEQRQLIGAYIQEKQEKIFVSTTLDFTPGVGDAKGIGEGLYNVYENPARKSAWGSLGVGIATVLPITDIVKLPKIVDKFSEISETAERLVDMVSKQGGRYGDLVTDGAHRHHMPAKQATPLTEADGPAIRMSPSDHRKTASYGGRKGSAQQAYRDKQADLIQQGKFDDAFLMDVDDIQSKFGNKYDDAILEAMDALP